MLGMLQCGSCAHNFDLEVRRPKMLPCGHTLCRACVRAHSWDGTVTCPSDNQAFYAAHLHHVQDDLQIVYWLEATAQGVLECLTCGGAFDGLLRRPAALDCGHSVCRVCLTEANDASSSAASSAPHLRLRLDSVDESWDYSSLEDGGGDSGSSTSSLRTDEGVCVAVGEVLVNCPLDGCLKGVRARDNRHVLDCLDGSAALSPAERAVQSDERMHAEVLVKLTLLESQIAKVGGGLGLGADLASAEDSDGTGALKQPSHFGEEDLNALMATLRWLIDHKDSPRSEPPGVFNKQFQKSTCNMLPDLLLNNKANWKIRDDVNGIHSLKECKVEYDVYDLSLHAPGEMRVRKEAIMRSDDKVWKLTGVDCWCDPHWTLRLLQWAAPHVEQLQLRYPGREHLQVVRDCMPHLRRLEIRGWSGPDLADGGHFRFDEGVGRKDTLDWLEVFLPAPTALSLLRAHRGSLRKVRFVVPDEWPLHQDAAAVHVAEEAITVVPCAAGEHVATTGVPYVTCEDDDDGYCVVAYEEDCLRSRCWDDLLREVGGGGPEDGGGMLSALSLMWLSSQQHDVWRCRSFARSLRAGRPNLAVECDLCRRIPPDCALPAALPL